MDRNASGRMDHGSEGARAEWLGAMQSLAERIQKQQQLSQQMTPYSPDGKRIAYVSYDGHDSEIYMINTTGGTPVQVTCDNTDAWGPDWGSRP